MGDRLITSLTNETVKAVRALHMRKQRDETGLFVAEGLKTVTEGVETGHAPAILMYGPEAARNPLLKKAEAATLAANGEVIEVTEEILEQARHAATTLLSNPVIEDVTRVEVITAATIGAGE